MTQQKLDYDWSTKKALIENAAIPSPVRGSSYRTKASPASCQLVLDKIASHGVNDEIYPSIKRLVYLTKLSRSAVLRSIARLNELGLICVRREGASDGKSRNFYTIVWSELALVDQRRTDRKKEIFESRPGVTVTPCPSFPPDQGVTVTDQGVTVTDQGVTVTDQGVTVKPEPPRTLNEPPPTSGEGEEILLDAGLSPANAARAVREFGIDAETADWIARTYRGNRKILRGPGAMWVFVEFKRWPVDGVVPAPTLAELAERETRAKIERSRRAAERAKRERASDEMASRKKRCLPAWESLSEEEKLEFAKTYLSEFELKEFRRGNQAVFEDDIFYAFENEFLRAEFK